MAVNDLVTVGAAPISVHAYWAAGGSDWFSDVPRMEDLVRGWQAACDVCEASWGGGETPALAGVVAPGSIDLAASCVGIVPSRAHLTLGADLRAGDAIVLLAASGIHANGVSLARKLVERFLNKVRQCRRVATRYDKLAANDLAFVQFASNRPWLRADESAP